MLYTRERSKHCRVNPIAVGHIHNTAIAQNKQNKQKQFVIITAQ